MAEMKCKNLKFWQLLRCQKNSSFLGKSLGNLQQ